MHKKHTTWFQSHTTWFQTWPSERFTRPDDLKWWFQSLLSLQFTNDLPLICQLARSCVCVHLILLFTTRTVHYLHSPFGWRALAFMSTWHAYHHANGLKLIYRLHFSWRQLYIYIYIYIYIHTYICIHTFYLAHFGMCLHKIWICYLLFTTLIYYLPHEWVTNDLLTCTTRTVYKWFAVYIFSWRVSAYGVATISRLLQIIGLFCKRDL